MDLEKIKGLLDLFGKSGLAEISLSEGGTSIRILRDAPGDPTGSAPADTATPTPPQDGTNAICSPLSGLAHRAPTPDAPPFVEVGARVEIGQPICVVEAMKVFNIVEADRAGTVTRILFVDGAEVDAGQPLVDLE